MTYYEWVSFIDSLKKGAISEENIQKLENSNITYTGDIKVRFLNQIVGLINYRLNDSLDNFIMKLNTIEQNSNTLILEINYLSNEIKVAKRLASIKHFDNNSKNSLLQSITNFGEDMKKTIVEAFKNNNVPEIQMIISNLNFNA